MVRPSRLVPLRRLMACSASSGVAISTKPKPRDRPVSRSVTTRADSTLPWAAKTSRRRSLDVENERPPTKSFTAISHTSVFRVFVTSPSAEEAWRRGLVEAARPRPHVAPDAERLLHPRSERQRPSPAPPALEAAGQLGLAEDVALDGGLEIPPGRTRGEGYLAVEGVQGEDITMGGAWWWAGPTPTELLEVVHALGAGAGHGLAGRYSLG